MEALEEKRQNKAVVSGQSSMNLQKKTEVTGGSSMSQSSSTSESNYGSTLFQFWSSQLTVVTRHGMPFTVDSSSS